VSHEAAVRKNGSVQGDFLSSTTGWKIVLQHTRTAGIEKLTPHDLRKTCAKLCKRAGGDLQQIQFLLGHSSIQIYKIRILLEGWAGGADHGDLVEGMRSRSGRNCWMSRGWLISPLIADDGSGLR